MPSNNNEPTSIRLSVDETSINERIDVYLKERLNLTRSKVQALIEDGFVKVNGNAVKPSKRLKIGESIDITLPTETNEETLSPEDISIRILYRDDDIVIVDKPPQMVVYPGPGHTSGTLINALLFHIKRLAPVGGPLRPGVVHRLDKDTSGVMVFAISERAYYGLIEIFKKRALKRRYICIVCGDLRDNEGTIYAPIGRAISNRKKISVRTKSGKPAITHWRVIERFNVATLLEIQLETGRTHQIRVHLAYKGHPVCGDRTYGRKTFIEKGEEKIRFPRQMLHAMSLSLRHPVTGRELDFESEIPEDMKNAIVTLRKLKPLS